MKSLPEEFGPKDEGDILPPFRQLVVKLKRPILWVVHEILYFCNYISMLCSRFRKTTCLILMMWYLRCSKFPCQHCEVWVTNFLVYTGYLDKYEGYLEYFGHVSCTISVNRT